MTEPRPLTDEDLCAVIDGVADPDLVARVRADPDASARAGELHAAAEALRAAPVTPLDPATVDTLIARAVGAAPADGRPDPVVTPLAPPARARRSPNPWLVAAAVVGLVAIGLGLVWSGTRVEQNELATVGDRVADEVADPASDGDTMAGAEDPGAAGRADGSGEAADAAPEAAPLPHGMVPTTGGAAGNESAVLPDLGSYATAADLRAALRDGFPDDLPLTSGTPVDSPTRGAVERCRNQAMVTFDLEGPADAEGVAQVDGRMVLVYEFDQAAIVDGNTYVIARGPDACDPVLDFQR